MGWQKLKGLILPVLAAWPLAGLPAEPGCVPGLEASPGTMTQMGFPCPEGAVPSNSPDASTFPSTSVDGVNSATGPGWNRIGAGASGVSGSSREADGAGRTPEAAGQPGTSQSGSTGSTGSTGMGRNVIGEEK